MLNYGYRAIHHHGSDKQLLDANDPYHRLLTSRPGSVRQGLSNNNTGGGSNPVVIPIHDRTFILACSAARKKRPLLSDKKMPFAHLRPRSLVMSVIRTTAQQGVLFFGNYLTDQLEQERINEELISEHKITDEESDEKMKQWEEKEWSVRIKAIPSKTISAFLKLQTATIIMRFYEYLASRYASTKTLDRLTKDLYRSSRNKATKNDGNFDVVSCRAMYKTCLWGTAINCLSDLTVQQGLLVGGYWMLFYKKKKRNFEAKGMAFSCLCRSCRMVVLKVSCWIVSSAGGVVGTLVYPGYGTLLGVQIGDGIVSALLEE